MIKKHFLSILFVCVTSVSLSQIHEIGFFVGGSNYVGEIGSTNYIKPNQIAGGLIYKYNYNPRMAFRATYSYIPISGDDKDATNPYRINRPSGPISFTNTIHEAAVGLEYNFFEYNTSEHDKDFTPYILAELAVFNYSKPNALTNPNRIGYENSISYTIPFGLGIKGLLADNLAYAFETKFRYTFVDDLDLPNNFEVFNTGLNHRGKDNDWYMFTGISIVYTFGRPACYTDAR